MVVDGAFKGVIGELVSIEMSLFSETETKIRVNYMNEIKVYNNQLAHIQPNIYGINVRNIDGSYKNGYEIIKELKEKEIMLTNKTRFNLNDVIVDLSELERLLNYSKTSTLMSNEEITDVNIIVPEKVVEVTFVDGTKEKAVCQEPDTYSFEQAISICLAKKVMGGSKAYNKAIRNGLKVYEDKLKKEAAEKKAEEEKKERIEKRRVRKERRAAKKREEQIEMQKEAYIRAMQYMKDKKNKKKIKVD